MKKGFIHITKLDLHSIINESLIELITPFLFIILPIITKNFSSSFIRTIILFIPIWGLSIMQKGFTFSFFINYIKTLDLLLIYFSVKYLVISLIISIIMILAFSSFTSIQIVNEFLSLIVVSLVTLCVYFLLFFYMLKNAELEIISFIILFILGNITFYVTYFLFNKIFYLSIALIVLLFIAYFKIIVPFFKKIMLNRFEIIIGKIL